MLTSTRVILRDKRGVTGKRVRYTSVPYTFIRAFLLETAGSVDTDQELKIHAVSLSDIICGVVVAIVFLTSCVHYDISTITAWYWKN